MSLKDVAQETLKIVREGKFINSLGKVIDFSEEQQAAEAGTLLYFQGCFERVVFGIYDPNKNQKTLKAFQTRF